MAVDRRARRYDVIVVGGGPAGSVTAWALARRGLRVAVLERARFPREKVCGDFVEPRGLRLLEAMGCLQAIEAASPLPVTDVAIFVQSRLAYRGSIPFYGPIGGLLPHGYIVPRDELDAVLLERARRAGAAVFEETAATGFSRDRGLLTVVGRRGTRSERFRGFLVVGADGTHSIVARDAGLLGADPRYMAVSQRAYADAVELQRGEAAFFFDRDLFPGYGWMFPIAGGRANLGVGILAETRNRCAVSVPALFQSFLQKLRAVHPGCARLRLSSRPLGGVVKTYGGAGRNCFDGGVLVGDAGCFVDPITGEGIAPAAESALIAAGVIADAVDEGRSDGQFLARYERDFRAYFDPAFCYLDLCAAVMRNRFMRDFWLDAFGRGCEMAEADPDFARTAGSGFGGMDVRPLSILSDIWTKLIVDLGASVTAMPAIFSGGSGDHQAGAVRWLRAVESWTDGWWRSALDDPAWHAAWAGDVLRKWVGVLERAGPQSDPRASGPLGHQFDDSAGTVPPLHAPSA